MAFLGPFNSAVINPSLVLLSEAMHKDSVVVAYSTTTAIIMGGVSVSSPQSRYIHRKEEVANNFKPFIFAPLTNIYGRRPITLVAVLFTVIGGIGSACSPSFGPLVGTRAITGLGMGGMMSVGTPVVNDIFFFHERGEKTGVYVIFVTNGAHIAALCISSLPHSPIFTGSKS